MVNAPIVPPVSGDLAPLPVPVPLLSEAHPRIFPGSPDTVRRYERNVAVPDEPTRYTIPPLTISCLPNVPPPGWTRCLHPEGAQYFFNEATRVFTDANLFDNESFMFINNTMHTIHKFLRAHNVQLDPDVDLVLDEYLYADQSKGCQYYFVNHKDRCVFWMDKAESDLFPVTQEVNGMISASHIRHELEAQYWYHCELFPRSLEVTDKIVHELRDILLHALGDLITSSTSTVPWKVDELHYMINLADGVGKNVQVGKNVDNKFCGSGCIVGRLMCLFVRSRVYNFHGEPGARLNEAQSVYGTVQKRTRLIILLSPLLFYAPDSNLVNLYTVLNDGLIRSRGWAELITKLHKGWREFTLYATVVLTANVAFLAIQSVDKGGNAVPDRSPTQILSYLSTSTSIGGIVVRLLLLSGAPDPRDMGSSTRSPLVLEVLAIIYSLPYAMLGWSMISFSAALSFVCFQNSSLSTRIPVAILWTIIAAFILLCILSRLGFGRWDWGWLRRLSSATILSSPVVEKDDSEPNPADETPKRSDRRWTWSSILIVTSSKLFSSASDRAAV
ncbi:hypothetical protein FB451DRAFT_1082841 [Mycena latifolia]|nr:hypothetical protein FB451DRAFT_1082841 [Mycena latifolia]